MILRWYPERSSESYPLQPAPAQNTGFFEARSYSIRKPFAGCQLYVDDEPLSDHPGDPACWLWSPRFFAGEVTAELLRGEGGVPVASYLLDVSPDRRKLGRDMFALMIQELWEEDPSWVVGSEPATNPHGELGHLEDLWAAFARMRRHGPEAVRAIAAIRARPRRNLRVRRDSLSLHQVRRVDRRTAVALLSSPASAMFGDFRGESTAFADLRLDAPVMEETTDCAANRAIRALLEKLLRRTLDLTHRLAEFVRKEEVSETRTAVKNRWPRRQEFLARLAADLKMLLRQTPFVSVARAEITAAGLTAVAADPAYSRAWSRGWRSMRNGLESDAATERLWVSPSWEIYERWCFVRLGQLLSGAFPSWGFHYRGHQWFGAHGEDRATLYLQPRFAKQTADRGKWWSISKSREPDMVFTVEREGATRFVVLDAKYRATEGHVLDAMESAHIYQDSLRIGHHRAEASLLLVPSTTEVEWLECSAFQAEHRVGIHRFAPGEPAAVPVMLANLLGV